VAADASVLMPAPLPLSHWRRTGLDRGYPASRPVSLLHDRGIGFVMRRDKLGSG
jgi:hypothetical protein